MQGKAKEEIPETGTFIWVDVRDLALCHVLAIEKEEAANKRFFITAGYFSNKEIAQVIEKHYPRNTRTSYRRRAHLAETTRRVACTRSITSGCRRCWGSSSGRLTRVSRIPSRVCKRWARRRGWMDECG